MRILTLSSSTGGGHDMRARSLTQWAETLDSKQLPIGTTRYQALEQSSPLYAFGVSLYNQIQKTFPGLHHAYFNFLELFQVSRSETLMMGKKQFRMVLQNSKPDLIVSVHAHLNHSFRKYAKSTLPDVKFITYCGEMHGGYGFSRHWVDPGADLFIGATPQICDAAEKLGMPKERIHYGGFLLHPNFYRPQLSGKEQHAYLAKLGLDKERFTLLLSTGANGAQNHIPFLEALAKANLNLQVIALCGRNEQARLKLETWAKDQTSELTIKALPYVDNMFPLMQSCDAIVARPGTGTTSEAILANCPILFNTLGGIMPQEWITVKYCRSQGLPAQLIHKAADLAVQIRPLIDNSHKREEIRTAMRKLIPPQQPPQLIARMARLADAQTQPVT